LDGILEKLKPPTIFHITHWKAGSQWVAEILKQSAPERFIPWGVGKAGANNGRGESSFRTTALIPGSIYGTMYVPRRNFERKVHGFPRDSWQETVRFPRPELSNWWYYSVKKSPYKCFFVMRDARDTLVSFYFSTKNSHKIEVDVMDTRRQILNTASEEDGLIYLINDALPFIAEIQTSWLGAPDILTLKYEDILGNELEFFGQLIDYCQINIDRRLLDGIINNNFFEKITGRDRGVEDAYSHYRKGIAGDWKNYFTDRVKAEFKYRFGGLLIETGYEKDLDW
jgi:hypothetical protein